MSVFYSYQSLKFIKMIYNQLQIKAKLKMRNFLNPEEIQNKSALSSRNKRSKSRDTSHLNISNYQIHQRVGKGSYAKVYKAIHKLTGQLAAVKVFDQKKMTKQEIDSVLNQVNIQKKLQHTNIVRIYEFYQNQDKIYVFMEFCQNGELFNYINAKGPINQKFASKIFKQILSALKYLKSQRIFHRDVKCQNILFDKNWNAKLADFGFAIKEQDGSLRRTFCGSPSYTAPELAKKQKYQAQMVDVWCLGVTLFAMLMGRLPFDDKQERNTRRNIIDMKYQIKKNVSNQVRQIFNLIFVDCSQRVSIQDLQETDFVVNGYPTKPNHINTNTQEITADPYILSLIEEQFRNKNSVEIAQSVTKFKMDANCSLYYLMVQNALLNSKGQNIKYDISCPNFEKKKKKVVIRSRKLSQDYRRVSTDKTSTEARDLRQLFPSISKSINLRQKTRSSLSSIEPLPIIKFSRRTDTPTSPKRILDLISAYRIRQ